MDRIGNGAGRIAMRRIGMLALGLCALHAVPAAEHAHVHGIVSLNVAIEGNTVTLQLEAPLNSLVGFEHAPRTDAQKQAVKAMLERFKSPQALFGLSPAAACTLKHSSAESAALKPDTGAKPAGADEHGDLDADIEFDCAQAAVLRSIDLSGLLAAFPRIRRIDAQVVSPAGQFKRTLRRPEKTLRWGQ
jgi:hypothetical protein